MLQIRKQCELDNALNSSVTHAFETHKKQTHKLALAETNTKLQNSG